MRRFPPAVALVIVLALTACLNRNDNHLNDKHMDSFTTPTENGIFTLGEPMPEHFTGTVHYRSLIGESDSEGLYAVGQVTFSPGARTHWHTHPAGQVLLVTGGRGWYRERSGKTVPLVKGTVVNIPKDVEHWHGASAEEEMVHIAISNFGKGGNVTWMSPVTDEEYALPEAFRPE